MRYGIHEVEVVETYIGEWILTKEPVSNWAKSGEQLICLLNNEIPSEEEQYEHMDATIQSNLDFEVRECYNLLQSHLIPSGKVRDLQSYDWLRHDRFIGNDEQRPLYGRWFLYQAIVRSHITKGLELDESVGSLKIKENEVRVTEGSAEANNGHGSFIGHVLSIVDIAEQQGMIFPVKNYTLSHSSLQTGSGVYDPFFRE